MRVAILADWGRVQEFALRAIDAVEGCDEISVFSCTNTRTRKKPLRHGAYYALNLLAIRSRATAAVPVSNSRKRIADLIEFESGYDGAWQVLPPDVVDRLRGGGFDVILKFGMGLLRVPPPQLLPVPILSYHHGDPDHYRGRPAGFWEILDGRPVIGQIVQAIGNRLDAGRVLAYAETKVHPHSYRATLAEAYRHSPLIINQAIANARAGTFLAKHSTGRNYRLPSNLTVARFAAGTAARLLRRLVYGGLVEKRWRVSTAAIHPSVPAALVENGLLPPPETWRTIVVAPGYSFYADPFYSSDPPGLLVEALNRRSGLGEIMFVGNGGHRRVSDHRGHLSYPATIDLGGRQFVVPESASACPPQVHVLNGDGLRPMFSLDVAGEPRILDPTLLEHDGRLYLFGNIKSVGPHALYIWSGEAIDAPFLLHPASPVRISPEGGRMAGNLVRADGRLIRFGQDFRLGYGDGAIAFEVEELSATAYRERRLRHIGLADRRGPHTVNFRDGEMVFDWYRERFAPGAGLRRLAAMLARPGFKRSS